jgi:nucleoside-diphosphate-sugar epimerase
MRIGITGATGFVGGAFVQRLLNEKADIQVLARPSRNADDLEARGARVIRGQLTDGTAVAQLVQGCDLVYHCAAKVDSPGTKAEFIDTNVNGTESVLRACLAEGVRRVIYLSSIAVYGLVKFGEHIDESTPYDNQPQQRDYYAQSKIMADQFAASFSRNTQLPLTIVRPGIVYGLGRPLPIGLLGFRAGRVNIIFGNPSHRFPLNYVENLVDALQRVAASSQAGLQQFNLVDDDDLTLATYHRIKTEVDGTSPQFFPGWPVLSAASLVDVVHRLLTIEGSWLSTYQVKRALQDRLYVSRRIREDLGWTPRVSLPDGLRASLAPLPT